MAKGLYYGVGGKARKGKNVYYGVAGKARRVKKMFIGIGGVARPFWGGKEITYYGKITSLSTNKVAGVTVNVGDYVLLGGGNG
jgi:hypothetical protein